MHFFNFFRQVNSDRFRGWQPARVVAQKRGVRGVRSGPPLPRGRPNKRPRVSGFCDRHHGIDGQDCAARTLAKREGGYAQLRDVTACMFVYSRSEVVGFLFAVVTLAAWGQRI